MATPTPTPQAHGQTWAGGEAPPPTLTWCGGAMEGWEDRAGCLWLGLAVRRGLNPGSMGPRWAAMPLHTEGVSAETPASVTGWACEGGWGLLGWQV